MKKIINILFGFGLYVICSILFMGYGHTETHPQLNDIIVLKFLERASTNSFGKNKFKNYVFNWNNSEQPALTGPALPVGSDFYLWYSASDEVDISYSPMEWIKQGGWMEDEPWGPASVCHFYDPVGIDGGNKWLTDCSGLIEATPALNQLKEYNSRDALSWAKSDPKHSYSWDKGKEYIVQALKEKNPQTRKRLMALAYRCLGQVMHLVSDMGCTPHVRNDSHPPKFSFLIGDPDPYEDLCKKLDVYSMWQANPPSGSFVNEVSSFEKFEEIFDKLARFTNENFFSGQTIYTDRFLPVIRPANPYLSPFLTETDYNKKEYTYYKNYEGVNVKMCKDKVPIPFQFIFGKDSTRGRPYLDYDCVKSIAGALFPNIAEAGANIIRLYIPSLKVEITEAKADSGGIIRGKVAYTIPSFEDEYSGMFDLENTYNGPVALYINGIDKKRSAEAINNNFEFKLNGEISDLKKGDIISASIEFGGIIIKADEIELSGAVPRISLIIPAEAKVGEEVSIFGVNFGTDKTKGKVTFYDNVDAIYISSWTDTRIDLKIPSGAKAGNVQVTYQKVMSNKYPYTIKVVAPSITWRTPYNGIIGDTITITGKDFGESQNNGRVYFGDLQADIVSWQEGTIRAVVPSGIKYYELIFVEVDGNRSTEDYGFTTFNWWLPERFTFTFCEPNAGFNYYLSDGSSGSDMMGMQLRDAEFNWDGMKFTVEGVTFETQDYTTEIHRITNIYKYSGELDKNGMMVKNFHGLKIYGYASESYLNDKIISLDSTVNTVEFKMKNIPYYGIWTSWFLDGTASYNNPNFDVYNIPHSFELIGYDIMSIRMDYTVTPVKITENLKTLVSYGSVRKAQLQIGMPK